MSALRLGDLRSLLERLADADDDVPVRLVVNVPGLAVNTGSFPTGPHYRPVVLRADAGVARIGQTPGYHPGMGPPSYIEIEGKP